MTDVLISIGLILVLILLGGIFVASEIALVSLRESQIERIGDSKRGRRVTALAANPNRFLAAVQIGVTAAGFLSAAFGEARLSSHLAPRLVEAGLSEGVADILSLILITLLISYVAITVGELVPKRLALQRPQGTALLLAPVVDRFARLARPAIWFLSVSTNLLVRVLGADPSAGREAMSEEELRDMVAQQETLTSDERKLIDEVFAAGERQVREVMIPRTEVTFLDVSLTVSRALKMASTLPHSRYPVVRGSADDVLGFLHVRDLLVSGPDRRTTRLGELMREVKLLPATKKVLPALSEMRRGGDHLAVVVDEYGGTAGIVTLEDLIEEVIGDIRDEYDPDDTATSAVGDDSHEVDGLLNLDEFAEKTGVTLPDGPYETAAGYVMAALGRLPQQGEAVEVAGHRLQVTSMEGRRVSCLLVQPLPPPDHEHASTPREGEEGAAAGELGFEQNEPVASDVR